MNHWDLMEQFHPELSEKVTEWRKAYGHEPVIPTKYQELMKMTMACILRYAPTIEAHGKAAMRCGATPEEVFEALALTMMIGGIPAYREGAAVLGDLIIKDHIEA